MQKSQRIQKQLFLTPEFKTSQIILFYASFDGEVDTVDMIKHTIALGKKVALPITLKDQKKLIPTLIEHAEKELQEGPYGIKQPKLDPSRQLDPTVLDLIIVPGLAFDRQNHRLGRGAGYYDRFLSSFPSRNPVFGLAFDFQIVDHLPPPEDHDIQVSRVIFN